MENFPFSSEGVTSLQGAQCHAKNWLFNVAAPLWSGAGVCDDGLFAERIALDGQPVTLPRRLMVQARQIYSFLTIGELGWDGPWRAAVTGSLDHILALGIHADGTFVHAFDDSGAVGDSRPDLYNQAFGMFALGHAARVLGRSDAAQVAARTMDRLDETWRRPEGGFWEGEITPCPPYRQNPHMHMFEAGVSLFRATGDARWQVLFEDIGALFQSRFQHAEMGAVTEYFDANWTPLPGRQGAIVEPGHCLEWAWLFETSYADGAGVAVAERLSAFARRFGLCAQRGVAINEVSLDGEIIDGNARLWPQTERLKAAVARHARLRQAETEAEVVSAYAGLVPYLATPYPGVWRDRWLANGDWQIEAAPASSFYHIVCALNELLTFQ
jgi:mannose/cellobiose epimerase-like protein (N-acyl-D-glucosamine 2-epimerase family)